MNSSTTTSHSENEIDQLFKKHKLPTTLEEKIGHFEARIEELEIFIRSNQGHCSVKMYQDTLTVNKVLFKGLSDLRSGRRTFVW
jgi:hypothetical protein